MTWSVVLNADEELIYIDPIVKDISWSGDIMQASRKLVVSVSNTFYTNSYKLIQFEEGSEILLLEDEEELFRGIIFSTNINDLGQMSITVYDQNIYLTKNKETIKMINVTASEVVKRLCDQFEIPYGQIDDTGYIIPRYLMKNKTLWEMMVTALTLTYKQSGRNFVLRSSKGKLTLLERKSQVVQWVLENGVNIISASYSRSIDELRNKVKVLGGDEDNPITVIVQDQALIDRYGIMQEMEERYGKDVKKSELEQLAKQQLDNLAKISDEGNLQALGISDVVSGCSVYVVEKMTGIVGGYYVTSDDHSYSDGSHKMSIKLSADDELPTMEYDPPTEAKETKQKKDTSSTSQYAYLNNISLEDLQNGKVN
jgi:hypothetical protein